MIWDLSVRQRKILHWVGYPILYSLCLLLFAYLTFPFERLKHRIISEFNAAQGGASGMRLQIDELSWYWVTGVEAQGVRLVTPPPPPSGAGKSARPQIYEIDDLHVRYSLLSGLVGSSYLSFGLEAGGGEVSGYVTDDEGIRTVAIEFDQMGITGLPFLSGAVGLPMTGSLSGVVELHLPERRLSKGDGSIDLRISGLSIGDGKAKIRDTLALPRINAGTFELSAKAKEGRVKLEKFSASGPDLELVSGGKMRLRDPFAASRADLSLRFKFTDKYKTKNDVTKGLFGEPGSKVPGAFDFDAKNQKAKRPDGFYAWRITGAFAKLNFRPAGAKAKKKKRSSRRRKGRSRRSRRSKKPKR